MSKQIALLRGINVGGKNKVPMAGLRKALTDHGFAGVATYVASGNVVFDDPGTPPEETAAAVEAVVAEEFGLRIPVIARTREEIAAVVAGNPLPEGAAEPARFLAVFLSGPAPAGAWFRTADPASYAPDRFAIGDRVVYVWCPGGIGRSKLAADFSGRKLGVTATARNWNTVLKLLEMADG
ncbi:hypothetical protein DMB38_06020 [Streptomyces sp. WAC 06738]|uniref:DUF1697 domain-containing protein n=1 Tax=Streptomyces sp. WAC 06738 TaxID=2203210 RepID=UPI000F6C68DB|nr:DUF1697 domain-containing protein [Streptomyces sp. WAC 06738]AZM45440.1 hypothetical protein DMB38_06020 [Streptomyces sp. WAC 06738]